MVAAQAVGFARKLTPLVLLPWKLGRQVSILLIASLCLDCTPACPRHAMAYGDKQNVQPSSVVTGLQSTGHLSRRCPQID